MQSWLSRQIGRSKKIKFQLKIILLLLIVNALFLLQFSSPGLCFLCRVLKSAQKSSNEHKLSVLLSYSTIFIPMKFSLMHINLKNLSTEENCLRFIAEQKWAAGYSCRKCQNTNYCKGRTPYSRRCTRCKHEESATSHTIFHRCHIPITEAFRIAYLVCYDPKVSTHELSRKTELRQMTCWKLKSKLIECLEKKGEINILYTENKE